MDAEQARTLLLKHSFAWDDLNDPTMVTGFLGSLRPYQGLRAQNFHDVMAALRALAPELHAGRVGNEAMGALWAICFLGKMWGVDPDGMLRSNGLISAEDTETLNGWINAIAYAVLILLDSGDVEEAFAGYDGPGATE